MLPHGPGQTLPITANLSGTAWVWYYNCIARIAPDPTGANPMTATCEERRDETDGEVLCRVMVENPTLIVAECERIARAIVEDRKLRTPAVPGRTRDRQPHVTNHGPETTGEHQQF